MENLTIEEIKKQYPNEWVLVGNPKMSKPDLNSSIVSNLLSGFVLCTSKDKKEIGLKAKDFRASYESTVCIFTGEINKNKLYLL